MLLVTMTCIAANGKRVTGSSPIGEWKTDGAGLPCFNYVGSVPYKATLATGDSVKLDSDPWFVLGNYQLTLFAHVSGQYELITGQRAWARMNQGDRKNTGKNDARLEVIGDDGKVVKTYQLVGMGSLSADSTKSKRTFGCGYAQYQYQADKLQVSRTLSVKPSLTIDGGASAFLITVTVRNKTGKTQRLRYTESVRAQYETMMQQSTPREWRKVKYTPFIDARKVKARFDAKTDDPLLFLSKDDLCKYEGFPPMLYMEDLSGQAQPACTNEDLGLCYGLTLRNGEEKQIQMIVGFDMLRDYAKRDDASKELKDGGIFSESWKKVLPQYNDEQDAELRRELTWHAYMLEAMATYSDYYHETKIPQGTIYDYFWGQHASARDNFQHALATIYYHPELTKSIMRYMMQRTVPSGEVMLIEYGNGFAEPTCYQTSDQQLWFFLLLSEYLRVTKDYAFLQEKVACYPVKDMPKYTILEHARHCYDYLRNQVGTGSHGLVRLMNSDWCDGIFYCLAEPYNVVQPQGESHMNTAMALSILPILAEQLEAASADQHLVSSIRVWRKQLYDAYMRDWGSRPYPRRMYFAGRNFGEQNLYLEPMGFTLQVQDIPLERRQQLYHEIQQKLYLGEKIAARQQEDPELTSDDLDYGSRENGGIWYSLNGPVICGIATFDKPEAFKRLKQMSLANHARQFPQYWSCYWSSADNIESSLVAPDKGAPGLPDQTASYAETAIACAHIHAWMLYCYNRLMER
ncbi:MAG: hypothetical protein IKX22_02585 [Prevotella sp.]|nr:hypothetical protein [Prevotella sp.]